jgi:hypothetical protein
LAPFSANLDLRLHPEHVLAAAHAIHHLDAAAAAVLWGDVDLIATD